MIYKLFLFLKPPSFKTLSLSTTTALSKEPPFANPAFFIFSISSNKQKVLDSMTSFQVII